jgi:hypothetical protein
MTVSAHDSDGGPGAPGGPGGPGGPGRPEESYAVGVDFGTLSGRAVVVRVSDGAEVGTAVCPYRHAVMDTKLAATGEPLPPDWPCRTRRTTGMCCGRRSRPQSGRPASTRPG